MSGDWDASIRQINAVECGVVSAPTDVVGVGAAFDVAATIRIGESLMSIVDCFDLFVAVRNLSRSVALVDVHVHDELTPVRHTLHKMLRAKIDAGWTAGDGDVLEILATLKVTAGVHTDYSLARSDPFVVGACSTV